MWTHKTKHCVTTFPARAEINDVRALSANPPLLAALPLLLAACQSMAPDYQRPAAPVAARYPQQADDAGEAVPALGWQAWFRDPQLQAIIAQALANNRDLRAAALRVEEARALYGIQRADLFPAIGAQAGLDRSRTPPTST
jgi:multidrug efflux system outer membrane protein